MILFFENQSFLSERRASRDECFKNLLTSTRQFLFWSFIMATRTGTDSDLEPTCQDGAFAKLLRLITSVLKLVCEGKRKAEEVARLLHLVKVDPEFLKSVFPMRPVVFKPVGAAKENDISDERERILRSWHPMD